MERDEFWPYSLVSLKSKSRLSIIKGHTHGRKLKQLGPLECLALPKLKCEERKKQRWWGVILLLRIVGSLKVQLRVEVVDLCSSRCD